MTKFEQKYNAVLQGLKKFNLQLEKIDQKCAEEKQVAKSDFEETEKRAQAGLSEILNSERQIQAFIEIARAHTSILNQSSNSLPLDCGKLKALMVLIDNSSQYDANAKKLYAEATGQLVTCKANRRKIEQERETAKIQLGQTIRSMDAWSRAEKRKINEEIETYFHSQEFQKFLYDVQNDFLTFSNHQEFRASKEISWISLGIKMVDFPVPDPWVEYIQQHTSGLFDPVKKQIGLPVELDLSAGSGIIFDYNNQTEKALLGGVQNILFNLARFWGDQIAQIVLIDPIRFNNSILGVLEPLASEKGSLIDPVPLSMEMVRKKLAGLISSCSLEERKKINQPDAVLPRRIFYFHDFPQAYDSTMIAQIQQLFMSARRYNSTVVIANNLSKQSMANSDVVAYMSTQSDRIVCDGSMFFVKEKGGKRPFYWYHAPKEIPQSMVDRFAGRQRPAHSGNVYEQLFDLGQVPAYPKGRRILPDIPVGVDEEGNIVSLNFENSNFATFICGAARSGKSTLLHTILTGLIRKVHPDDVEIWLIDFKMTEFSRYMKHLPPHVRYILLDESPELVYDIIDRLMEILMKRQNRFKENWLKLADVPPEKYMPAIFVIIDEFSIMSNIIAGSANSKQDYREKMQTLLAKGAALGFHFIFSSQDFTSGTSGLSELSKKQIQQRIAMKTEYNEIRETLDLRSLSDEDRAAMEQIQPYYALLRVQEDEKGNHLRKMKTIYIADYKKQEVCIDAIAESVKKEPKYNLFDPKVYIDKQPMIVDGSHYHAFSSEKEKMLQYLSQNADTAQEMEETYLFPGEPKKMAELYPLELFNGFCENILIFAPVHEKQPLASLLTSLMESLGMQRKWMSLWTTPRNIAYRAILPQLRRFSCPVCRDIDEVCGQILEIKNKIRAKKASDHYIFLLGAETLLLDMSFQGGNPAALQPAVKSPGDGIFVEKREEGEMDLETLLQSLDSGMGEARRTKRAEQDPPAFTPQENRESYDSTAQAYDARSDLKYILAQGPRFGYHFILVFNTVEEFQQSRIDLSLFKHKLFFRTAKMDAVTMVGGSEAEWISNLSQHTFRYTNGLDALSFRPYLYPGLSWDGWEVKNGTAFDTAEEEYLM